MLSISAQVLGGLGTRSLRYQSSWVLVLYGTAYSLPFQVAVSQRRLEACPRSACAGCSPGPRQDPAGLGELRRPGDVQAEDVERAVLRGEPADELLPLAVGGRAGACCTSIRYRPPEARLQLVAASAKRARVVGEVVPVQRRRAAASPLVVPPPQAASSTAARPTSRP